MQFFTRLSIQSQIAILIVVIQLTSHVVSFSVYFQFVYNEENPPPVALTVAMLEPISTVASIAQDLNENDLRNVVLRHAAKVDERMTLIAADDRRDLQNSAENEELNQRVKAAAFPLIADEDIMVFNTGGSSAAPFRNEDFHILLWLSEDYGLQFEPSKGSISRTLPFLTATYGLFALGISLIFIAIWASKTLISPLNRLAFQTSKLPSQSGGLKVDENGPAEIRIVAHAFNEMRERVEKAMKERTLALAAISHDLRTPLTRLRLKIETGRAAQDPDSALEDIDGLEQLIDVALEYLRFSSQSIELAKVDLRSLLEELITHYSKSEFSLQIDTKSEYIIDANKSMITRMIENIFENTVKYAPHSQITVCLWSRSSIVHLKISDRGPGVPENRLRELVNPFTTGDDARNHANIPSLGLGLSIASDIAQRHGGDLKLHNREGGGLEVSIMLPIDSRR